MAETLTLVEGKIRLKDGPPPNLRRVFVRGVRLEDADLAHADLREANLSKAKVRSARFDGADLRGAILDGADLTGAKGLTVDQLAEAVIDEETVLPDYIDRDELKRMQRERAGD